VSRRDDLTVIATTGERFGDFAPYVASVNNAGTVAFQAALREGGTGVFIGDGGQVESVAGVDGLTVSSHPDLNNEGATSFYTDDGVVLVREDRLETIADTSARFTSIGPLGPTMNEAGAVAFRADLAGGVSGIFAGNSTVADTSGAFAEFHGLPVINESGTVVFRADRTDGVQGIYAARDGEVEPVVETGESFESLAAFPSANDDGTVAFAAGAGIFTVTDGRVGRIDEDGMFEWCRGALIDNHGGVVVIATPPGGTLGLYTGKQRILGVGDALFGSTVEEFVSNPVSVNDRGQLAIRVKLADGKQLIILASCW
jgi:hypothetical protein